MVTKVEAKPKPKVANSIWESLLRTNSKPGKSLPLDFSKHAREIPINIGPATYTDLAVGLFRHLGLIGADQVEGLRDVVAETANDLRAVDANRQPRYSQELRLKYGQQVGGTILTYLEAMRDLAYEHYGSDIYGTKIDSLQQLMGKLIVDQTTERDRSLPEAI